MAIHEIQDKVLFNGILGIAQSLSVGKCYLRFRELGAIAPALV